jgi:L-amino acid N-acyltransferase YncA
VDNGTSPDVNVDIDAARLLVEDILSHQGVKGMHWGVRKDHAPVRRASDSHTLTTSKGEKVTLEGMKTPIIARGLANISSGFRKKLENSDSYHIRNATGEKVGELYVKKDPAEKNATNVVWIETHDKHKGKGYATGVMHKVVDIAKKQGRDKVTLEVPGISPDARHIYEKLGFKSKGMQKGSHSRDIWGGLTRMELDLKSAKHSDDSSVVHFGVKGMHWGVRKGQSSSGSAKPRETRSEDSANVQKHLATINKHGVKALSNKELQDVVTRLNLHQQYSNLTGGNTKNKTSVDKGHDAVKKILAIHGTLSNAHKAYNSPLMKAVRVGLKTTRATQKAGTSAGGHAAKFVVKQLTK